MTREAVLSAAAQAGSFDEKWSVVDVECVGFVRFANFNFGRAAGRIHQAAARNCAAGEKRQTDCAPFFSNSLFAVHNLNLFNRPTSEPKLANFLMESTF